ncbi:hypothetical protein DC522_06075 [Microvirga sp. KLBC 81]|uniref:ferric reductase-like transmembrane domain-containing protein n=1 Tax=Microvirga sp. KLBC 81 TaxID=1862707 RepID=UPI000D51DB81|nr:ferric reductase-like transmembrane domain-containing protein [Microvirga sp. KLBC 81]PVE25461.1 hypothetical protein DC522_06075 [Microvirga sp. KLBC 81]
MNTSESHAHDASRTAPHPWRSVLLAACAIMAFSVVWLYLRRFGAPIGEVYVKLVFASVPVTGMVLIGICFLIGPLAHFSPSAWTKHLRLRKPYGLLGLFFVAFHTLWALVRLAPAHYPEFFGPNGALTPAAELSMLAGVASLMILAVQGITSLPSVEARMAIASWRAVQRLGYLALALALGHFLVIKWQGWVAIGQWPYGLPPLSLLLLVFLVAVFGMRLAALFSSGTSKTRTTEVGSHRRSAY